MTTPPPSPPGGRKHARQSAPPPMRPDDYEFEGDPTSISQGPPQPQLPASRPSAPPHQHHPQQPIFASGSPQLSHVNQGSQMTVTGYAVQPALAAQQQPQPAPLNPSMLTQQPGPPMTQISGVIAQPTPYVA